MGTYLLINCLLKDNFRKQRFVFVVIYPYFIYDIKNENIKWQMVLYCFFRLPLTLWIKNENN